MGRNSATPWIRPSRKEDKYVISVSLPSNLITAGRKREKYCILYRIFLFMNIHYIIGSAKILPFLAKEAKRAIFTDDPPCY